MPDINPTDNQIGLFGFQNAKDFDDFMKTNEGKKNFNELVKQHIEKVNDEELMAAYLEMEHRRLQILNLDQPSSDEEKANQNNEEWTAEHMNTLNRQAKAIALAEAARKIVTEISRLKVVKEKFDINELMLQSRIESLQKEKIGLKNKFYIYYRAVSDSNLNSFIIPSSVASDGTVKPAKVNKELVTEKQKALQEDIKSLQAQLDDAINSDKSPEELSAILNEINALSLQDACLQDLLSVANEDKRYVDGEGRTVGIEELSKAKFIIGKDQILKPYVDKETGKKTYGLFNKLEDVNNKDAREEAIQNFERTKNKTMVLSDLIVDNQILEQGHVAEEVARARVRMALIKQSLDEINLKMAELQLRLLQNEKAARGAPLSAMPNTHTCPSLMSWAFNAIKRVFENKNSDSQSANSSSAKQDKNSHTKSM